MLPACFDNFIGIRAACSQDPEKPAPSSGLYLEDLTGVDLSWAAKAAQKNDLTGISFMESAINEAIVETKAALFQSLSKYSWYTANADLDYQSIGEIDDYVFDTLTTSYRGVRVERTPDCNRLLFKVPCVSVLTETDQTVDLQITDGPNVTNWTVETIGGTKTTAYIDYTIQSKIAYIEASNGDFAITALDSNAPSGCKGCQPIGNEYYRINGWDGSSRTNQTYGLFIDFLFQCDEWGFLCKLRHRLGLLIRYKAGEIMVRKQLLGARANSQTENIGPLASQKKYFKGQFEKELKNVIQRLPDFIRNYDSPCFQCWGASTVSLIP